MGVSRSGYNKWKNRLKREATEREKKRGELKRKIKLEHIRSKGRYGAPKITAKLNKAGIKVDQKQVGRLMSEMGIASKTARKYKATTYSKHKLPIFPNLLNQNFKVDAPGKAWVTDITYIWTKEGWLYLASVLDLYSRRVLGFQTSDRMNKELVITALERAIAAQPPKEGLIHHSDRGSQYASKDYQKILRKHKMATSMSRKGNCYDNAVIESFHSIIKKELIFHETYASRAEARKSVFEYIVMWYNSERIHSSIDNQTPFEFEMAWHEKNRRLYSGEMVQC
jgi:transposase InsO family protein